jgi:trigger factor
VLPPIDEEFVRSWGFDSEEELRAAYRSRLESRLDETIKEAMCEQIAQYLLDQTKLDIPQGLSQRQTDRSVDRRRMQMYQAGIAEVEIAKRVDQMRAKAHDQVERDLKLYFILEKIADEKDIDVTEEQLNGAIAMIAAQTGKRFDRVRDELSKGNGLMSLYVQLRDERVLEQLLQDAQITETEGPEKKGARKDKKTTAKNSAKKETADE